MRVFGPYGVILLVMEAPKLKSKVVFNERILIKRQRFKKLKNFNPSKIYYQMYSSHRFAYASKPQFCVMTGLSRGTALVSRPDITSSNLAAGSSFFCTFFLHFLDSMGVKDPRGSSLTQNWHFYGSLRQP